MSSIAAAGFPGRSNPDRNAFLFFTALVWAGVLSGFGMDSYNHVSKYGLDYPLIVHFHAAAFVGWLALFTTQVLLIRKLRPDVHRRLGTFGVALAAVMVFLGPATALVVDAHHFETSGKTPEFLAVQFADIIAFATLAGSGMLLRKNSPVHKRLMLLALFYISDAGFARFLNPMIVGSLGQTYWGGLATLYLGGDALILGLGIYDLSVRRRLYPAYVIGVAWVLLLQFSAYTLLSNQAWKAITLHLIGH